MAGAYAFTCTEEPLSHPFALTVQKRELDTDGGTPSGTAGWGDAVFRVDYYENDQGNAQGDIERTWYFKTDASGTVMLDQETGLVEKMTLPDGTAVASDPLFYDREGRGIVYPLGTYRVTEVQGVPLLSVRWENCVWRRAGSADGAKRWRGCGG